MSHESIPPTEEQHGSEPLALGIDDLYYTRRCFGQDDFDKYYSAAELLGLRAAFVDVVSMEFMDPEGRIHVLDRNAMNERADMGLDSNLMSSAFNKQMLEREASYNSDQNSDQPVGFFLFGTNGTDGKPVELSTIDNLAEQFKLRPAA